MQELVIAEVYRVVKTRTGAPVEFVDMVVLIAKRTAPSFSFADKSKASVVELQL
jgi:hypothetical protein